MSSLIQAATRRRRFWLASTFLVPVLSLGIPAARAQQAPADQLPPIEVSPPDDANRTRAKPATDEGSGPHRPAPNTAQTNNPNAEPSGNSSAGNATTNRQFAGIVGASTTVITAEDIAHSPAQSVQEIIAQTPGVQLTSFYGGVNGVGTSVDLRGFGAFATANSLVLINGRRLNDIDLMGVDFSTIPRDSIERIEITRGNSGAVLYGDGAVGGVINIVTKNGVNQPNSARIESAFGSFRHAEGNASVNASSGPFAVSLFGDDKSDDGYRRNNVLRQQTGMADFRYTGDQGTAFATINADQQHLGLPGGRFITLAGNELVSDPLAPNSAAIVELFLVNSSRLVSFLNAG